MSVSKNNVYVTWQSNPQGRNGEIAFVRSINNGSTFEQPTILSAVTDNGDLTTTMDMAVSENEKVLSVWSTNRTGNEEVVITELNQEREIPNMPIQVMNITLPEHSVSSDNGEKSKNIALIQRTSTDAAYDNSF